MDKLLVKIIGSQIFTFASILFKDLADFNENADNKSADWRVWLSTASSLSVVSCNIKQVYSQGLPNKDISLLFSELSI